MSTVTTREKIQPLIIAQRLPNSADRLDDEPLDTSRPSLATKKDSLRICGVATRQSECRKGEIKAMENFQHQQPDRKPLMKQTRATTVW